MLHHSSRNKIKIDSKQVRRNDSPSMNEEELIDEERRIHTSTRIPAANVKPKDLKMKLLGKFVKWKFRTSALLDEQSRGIIN